MFFDADIGSLPFFFSQGVVRDVRDGIAESVDVEDFSLDGLCRALGSGPWQFPPRFYFWSKGREFLASGQMGGDG